MRQNSTATYCSPAPSTFARAIRRVCSDACTWVDERSFSRIIESHRDRQRPKLGDPMANLAILSRPSIAMRYIFVEMGHVGIQIPLVARPSVQLPKSPATTEIEAHLVN